MSLNSIRTNYSKLLQAFKDAGVKLSESQKSDIDNFILALESKISTLKENTIKATKKVVSEHLDKQYRKVFESIQKHQAEHAEIAAKVQTRIAKINESKRLSTKLDNYLDLYVESVLPKKTIVDYDRMHKLENLFESMKSSLLINDDVIESERLKLDESYAKKTRDLETKVAKLTVKLNESMDKELALNRKLDQVAAEKLVESKVADLPDEEAKAVRKRLAGASTTEVKKKFNKIFESVKEDIKKQNEAEEASLEAEIEKVLKEEDVDEDDMLKNRVHNKHKSVKETEDDEVIKEDDDLDEDDMLKNRVHNKHKSVKETEDDEINEDDDIELEESEKIDANFMKMWCDRANLIQTEGY